MLGILVSLMLSAQPCWNIGNEIVCIKKRNDYFITRIERINIKTGLKNICIYDWHWADGSKHTHTCFFSKKAKNAAEFRQ